MEDDGRVEIHSEDWQMTLNKIELNHRKRYYKSKIHNDTRF